MKRNILYMDSGTGYGGSAKNLWVILKNLDRSLYNPIVIVPQIGPQIEKIMEMGVKVYQIPIPKLANISRIHKLKSNSTVLANAVYYLDLLLFLIAYLPVLLRIIKKHKISLVHGNNGIIDHFPVIFVARLLSIPIVLHVSGTEYLTRIEKFLSRWVKHFIVLNPLMKKYYQTTMGNSKTSLIDNGVDLDEIPIWSNRSPSSPTRADFGIDDADIVIGTVARVVTGKGLRVFINAAREVTQKYKNIKYIIIGDNPQGSSFFFDSLKELVNDSGLSDHVIFAGWQNDVYGVLELADIVAQVSTYPEGMSLAPMEAMALSKPVIVSENPGYERTIITGVSGLRVPAGEHHALAMAELELIENPKLARKVAANGRKRVEQLLNARNMVNNIQAIYESLLI